MNRKALTALFATLAVAGCTLAPDYQQPASPVLVKEHTLSKHSVNTHGFCSQSSTVLQHSGSGCVLCWQTLLTQPSMVQASLSSQVSAAIQQVGSPRSV